MKPWRARPRWLLAVLAPALLAAHAGAAAAQPPAPAPATLTVAASDEDGAPLAAVAAGQHWVVAATLTPYAPGQRVDVVVARGAQVLASGSMVAEGPGGRALLPVRIPTPGPVTVFARHPASAAVAAADAVPLGVVVRSAGRPRPGCRAPAEVLRDSRAQLATGRARRGVLLYPGAVARVPDRARLRLRRRRSVYAISPGRVHVGCRSLALDAGSLRLATGRRRGVLAVHGALVSTRRARTRVHASAHPPRVGFRAGAGRVTSAVVRAPSLDARRGDVVLIGARGLPRLNTWPFARSPDERRARRARVPAFWADGVACSVGCRPRGARAGWPLKPFHRQHPLRAGLNELRTANLHVGIDIQARDGARVYAMQSGRAHLLAVGLVDERVHVGAYLYWHVHHRVHEGQYVHAYRTVVGRVLKGAGHLHLSEMRGGEYLNPLRPGGRVLAPWHDREPPVIGEPVRLPGGRLNVEVFDPQSLRATIRYRTPALAPAAVAYRARDGAGRPVGPLWFALRGSQHLPDFFRTLVYGPGAHAPDAPGDGPPGWACFWSSVICVPRWNYRLAGGLAPPLPAGAASVTVYAWDWAGNVERRRVKLA